MSKKEQQEHLNGLRAEEASMKSEDGVSQRLVCVPPLLCAAVTLCRHYSVPPLLCCLSAPYSVCVVNWLFFRYVLRFPVSAM